MSETDNNSEGQKPQTSRLSVWAVIKYACSGVPICVKRLDRPWKEIQTPRFPFFFSILPWLFAIVVFIFGPLFSKEELAQELAQYEFVIDKIIYFVVEYLIGYCLFMGFTWVPFVVNALLFGWCILILYALKVLTKQDVQVIKGAQRVVYFGAFFQCLFFCAYLYLPLFFIDFTAKTVTGGVIAYGVIVSVAALVRITSVFQGMRLETEKNIIAGFLSTLVCFDIWLYLISGYVYFAP